VKRIIEETKSAKTLVSVQRKSFFASRLILVRAYPDHLEFRNVKPKFDVIRRCFESLSTNSRFRATTEGGDILYLIQV
jgi:hypothetical protein